MTNTKLLLSYNKLFGILLSINNIVDSIASDEYVISIICFKAVWIKKCPDIVSVIPSGETNNIVL